MFLSRSTICSARKSGTTSHFLLFSATTRPLFSGNPILRRRAFLVAIAESKGRLLSQYISQSAPSAIRASRNVLQREKAVRRYGIPDFVGARLVPPLRRHERLHVRVRIEPLPHNQNVKLLLSKWYFTFRKT